MSNHQNPIGQRVAAPSDAYDQGEHGAGVGVSGGHSSAGAHNSQSGGGSHPIADKFLGHQTVPASNDSYSAFGTGRSPMSQGVTGAIDSDPTSGYSSSATGTTHTHHVHSHHQHNVGSREFSALGASGGPVQTAPAGTTGGFVLGPAVGAGSHEHGLSHTGHSHTGLTHTEHTGHSHTGTSGEAVSGAYGGTGAGNALTGQSHAHSTGAGVGPLAENLDRSRDKDYNTGVRPAGGAGGHNTTGSGKTGSGYGGLAAGAAGVTGAGVAGAHSAEQRDKDYGGTYGTAGTKSNAPTGVAAGVAAGVSGDHVKDHNTKSGAPIMDPHELDSGGRHGLVFQESTGKYVHRRDL